ncbi:MAG: hemolysin family protein [Gaiellaceae bacterium]
MSTTLELVAVAVLILLNGFFVAAEYGLVTARRTRIMELQHAGNRRARAVLKIVAEPPRFIAAMQLGVTLTSLAIGALGEPALARVFDPVLASILAIALAFLIITFLHVLIGELVPKGIALGHSERVALAVSTPVRGFFVLAKPVIWALQRSSELVLRLLGLEPPGAEGDVHSEAELKMLLSASTKHGEIELGEQEMLNKVFDFADKEASDVMVPRPQVVAISVAMPSEQALVAVIDSPFTRYPVYRDSLDDILGILHVRDLFRDMHDRGLEAVRLEDLIRPAHMVPETKDLAALLTEFRRTSQHMAIVVNEYGNMEGIVTLEDLIEEIVGEIEDEYDVPDENIERIDEHTVRIHGTFPIDDFNEQFGVALPGEDFHTVAGFVFGQLGRAPEPGDSAMSEGVRLEVYEVEGTRIDRLTATFDERRRDADDPDQPEALGA